MRLLTFLCALVCLLSGCGLPDRWNASYSRQPASGVLPARDTYTVGISGPLFSGRVARAEPLPTPP